MGSALFWDITQLILVIFLTEFSRQPIGPIFKGLLFFLVFLTLEDGTDIFLLRIRNISEKNCKKNQNTHFMFMTLFLKSFR
jgi:hypothetical protein